MSETLQVAQILMNAIGITIVITVLSIWVKMSNKQATMAEQIETLKRELEKETKLREQCEQTHNAKR